MFTVHRAESADVLVDVLTATLAEPLADPMASEVVSVAERGTARWLSQQVAVRLGIAANIEFPSPAALLRTLTLATAPDTEAVERWQSDALRWAVLDVIDANLSHSKLAILAAHLAAAPDLGRRFSTASTIARSFRSYGWQRPSMITDWAAGRDTDGAGNKLADYLAWQPWLWRLVRERIGSAHPAEHLPDALTAISVDPEILPLPPRLGLFAPARLDEALHRYLDAVSAHRDVTLYLPHPSDALWRNIRTSARASTRTRVRRTERRDTAASHPLLAALSGESHELCAVLEPSIGTDQHHAGEAPEVPTTVLAALQAGLGADRLDTTALAPDSSVEIHACHGPERQVEVLRDRLLALIDANDELQSRDILVLCPDVATFEPLIRGAFGGSDAAGSLRVRLADRGFGNANLVLETLARVLDLAAGRVRASELVDLVESLPVRTRFGFTDSDLDTLTGWIARSGIRWGADQLQRERYGLRGFPQGTLATGVDRILLGAVAEESEDQWLGTALPLAGVDSTDTDLAGRFAEFADRLTRGIDGATSSRTATAWSDLLITLVDELTDVADDEEWQHAQAIGLLTEAFAGAAEAGDRSLDLADVRDLVAGLLASRPTRSNYCTGELTVCSMAPMRSVPHRVIAVLGMDSGVYPRANSIDGDNVLAVAPLIGERNRRDEDRQVFLDAIVSATDHLLVFYTGANPLTGTTLPPAVVVSELIDATTTITAGRGSVVHRQPLQAFDIANFTAADRLGPVSYDLAALAGARALHAVQTAARPAEKLPTIRDARLAAPEFADVDLDDLISFLAAPVEGFARQRLGIGLPEETAPHRDELSVGLDGLEQWGVGARYLQALLDGRDAHAAQGAELRRGTLPPFALGAGVFGPIREKAQAIATAAEPYRSDAADAIDIRVDLPGGQRLYGTVGDVFDGCLVPVNYSRLGIKHRLAAWIRLLALAAGSTTQVREAVVVGSAGGRRPAALVRRLHAPDDAAHQLAVLVGLRQAGLHAPIGLTLDAAHDGAVEFARRGNADQAMRRAQWGYERSFGDKNRYANFVFTGDPANQVSFDDLAVAVPELAAIAALEPHLAGGPGVPMYLRLASALMAPMVAHEEDR